MTVKIARISETEAISLPRESWSKKLLTGETVGAGKCMLGVSRFTPGTVTSMLTHQEEELAYVLKGKGKIRLRDGEVSYEQGDGIYISPGTPHSVVNDGDEDVEMVFAFSWPDYPPTEKG
ncbi:MAG: cupin domain-containing protein [Deltaproteobacteria bacterium]|nr:cupin domain-containing protein [Deltaproteobacteria bacterium]